MQRGADGRAGALERLEADGLLQREGGRPRTTHAWRSAMARAARRLDDAGDAGSDLRVPIAMALVEVYGDARADEELAPLVEAMLPIEVDELDPRGT